MSNQQGNPEELKVFQVDESGEQKLTQFETKTAFLKVPLEAKDEVAAFVESLSGIKQDGGASIDPALTESGCFFVVSLDKVEKIMKTLEGALSLSDDDGAGIKAEVREALRILNS